MQGKECKKNYDGELLFKTDAESMPVEYYHNVAQSPLIIDDFERVLAAMKEEVLLS